MQVLAVQEWREREHAHVERADALTAGRRARARRGERHPVEDFLYTYYPTRLGQLRRWHPGSGRALADAVERGGWRWYLVGADGAARVDDEAYLRDRSADVRRAVLVLRATLGRTAQVGCLGLHEWAMVYRASPEEVRHAGVPLRLGHDGTDAVVEANRLRCSHFDAFRFFTPAAVPRNAARLTREGQPALEQPGCLHATMDVYRWCLALGPLVPGEVLLDAFALAAEVRELDMRASPYDLAEHGYAPVRIETPAGRAEYVAAQRSFAARGQALRRAVLACVPAPLLRAVESPPPPGRSSAGGRSAAVPS